MATIKHKRSDVSGAVPTANDLVQGELALNTTDAKLFTKKTDGTVVELNTPQSIDGGEIVYDSLPEGLLGFWLLDEAVGRRVSAYGSGPALYDANCSAGTTSGVVDSATLLNNRSYLYALNSFSAKKSISFWLKLGTLPTTTESVLRFNSSPTELDAVYTEITVNNSGVLQFTTTQTSSAELVLTSSELSAGVWYHFAVCYSAAYDNFTLFQNGVSVSVATAAAAWPYTSNHLLILGPTSSLCAIDCLGIWNKTLTQSEVTQLYGDGDAYSLAKPSAGAIDKTAFVNVEATAPITNLDISVTGSSSQLYPAFDTDIHDYCILTNTNVVGTTINYSLTVNSDTTSGTAVLNKLIRVFNGANEYYIRLLPSDMPIPSITTAPTSDYIPGYYLTTGRRDGTVIPNYNMIYNELGVPVWYQTSPGGSGAVAGLIQPGNDINKVLVGRRGAGGDRYALTIADSAVNSHAYNLLPATKNGHTYQFDWQQHEFFELSGPPSRRGNIITCSFIPTPASNTTLGAQAIADKAFGIYIQEQSSAGVLVWDWWSGDYFNTSTATYAASFFHANALDVNPITGDIVVSFRGCSALLGIDYQTKNVKWVIQGPAQPAGTLASVADPTTTADTQFLQLANEPEINGYQFAGTAGQHHVKFRTNVDPLTPGNDIISVFDNQTNFFPGNNTAKNVSSLSGDGDAVTGTTTTAHGFAVGNYVQITGASDTNFNGVYAITLVPSTTTFKYAKAVSGSTSGSITATKATNYFPGAGPQARCVTYEINLATNTAIQRSTIVGTGPSTYLGSYTILEHPDGRYSHVADWNSMHPVMLEYSDAGNGLSPGSVTFAMDLPGDYYRIIKTPKEFFDLDYLRATATLPVT
jgi:hypothetical protein